MTSPTKKLKPKPYKSFSLETRRFTKSFVGLNKKKLIDLLINQ